MSTTQKDWDATVKLLGSYNAKEYFRRSLAYKFYLLEQEIARKAEK